jgi:hypothetical protein
MLTDMALLLCDLCVLPWLAQEVWSEQPQCYDFTAIYQTCRQLFEAQHETAYEIDLVVLFQILSLMLGIK